ncbi:IS3 family transposase [Staphylococcus xylosus]
MNGIYRYVRSDYVNWYNNFRPHSSLHYLTPVAFKNLHMKSV